MLDWLAILFGFLFFLVLVFCVWLICRGCTPEDIFLIIQELKLPEQNDPTGYFEAGKILFKKEKYAKALVCFEEVFKYDPQYPNLDDYIQTCQEKLYKDFEGW